MWIFFFGTHARDKGNENVLTGNELILLIGIFLLLTRGEREKVLGEGPGGEGHKLEMKC